MEEQFKTLTVLSHYLEVYVVSVVLWFSTYAWLTKLLLPFADWKVQSILGWSIQESSHSWSCPRYSIYGIVMDDVLLLVLSPSYFLSIVYLCYVVCNALTRELFAGFEQAIQAYAIHVLSLTYQRVPRSVLAEVSASILYINHILFGNTFTLGALKISSAALYIVCKTYI